MSEKRPPIISEAQFPTIREHLPILIGNGLKIGIVTSRFNAEFCRELLAATIAELRRLGVRDPDITIATVPGALEIALALQNMAQSGRFGALIALGCVIRGETYHFEIVSNESSRALMDVQLTTGIPIANGILSCENAKQVSERVLAKGEDCARAAVEMAHLCQELRHKGYQ